MRIPRAAAILLLGLLWQCRQATLSEPAPGDNPGSGAVPIVPGPKLHRPETGSSFRPDSAPAILPPAFPDLLGGGSQTETLKGVVLSAAGTPEPRIRVQLAPSHYDPSDPSDPSDPGAPDTSALRSGITDDSGRFVFDRLDASTFYNVIAGAPGQTMRAYAESLRTRPDPHPLSLRPTSAFFIRIRRNDGSYATGDSGVAFFPGTGILVRCNSVLRPMDTIPDVPFGLEGLVVRSRVGWEHRVKVPAEADKVLITARPDSVSIVYLP